MKKKVTIGFIIITLLISIFLLLNWKLNWNYFKHETEIKASITKKPTVKPNLITKDEMNKLETQANEERLILKATKKSVAQEIKPEPPPIVEVKPPNQTPSALSTKRLNWGYKPGANGTAPGVSENFKSLLSRFNGIYLDKSGQKSVYLTFDEGYENGYTPAILDVLKSQQVTAAFFVTGTYVTNNPSLVKRMDQEGYIIGNHTWHHYNLSDITADEIKVEMDYVKKEIAKVIGQKEIRYMRPPTGAFSELSLDTTNQLGYQSVFWSVAYKDWVTTEQQGWQHAYDSVMPQIHPGAIILLHAVSKDNAEALDKIITDLKAQGYTFKSLDQYGK